ncbi:MAG: glycosyltransferase [Nitrospira sp. CR2.1]|nr:glycosyltransferase [Nitrospira sp. CR2.1]MBA5875051.1 glycosyltransferase [Nitrospira sp. CR1.2]
MTTHRRLLIIGPTPPPYHGVAVAMQTLLQSSLVDRFRVSHLDLADRRGIQHVNKPDLHDVVLFCQQWIKLISILARKRPAATYLVLSQSTIGFIRDSLLLWPAFIRGSRLVLHLHGGNFREWFLGRSWLMRTYVRTVLGRATRVVVLGESFRNLFEGIVAARNVCVVPNGVDCPSSGRTVRRGDSNPRYRVLHLSTLSHLKGALVLLKAIPFVVRHRQDVEFIFAGPWSHEQDQRWAEAFIAQEGVSPYIRFTGQVDGVEKQALFETSHLFVFPGVQQEGQPLVVLEAMAAGLPVIYTDRGCLRETVGGRECGLEVRVNDAADLADRIVWLLDHQEECNAMGLAGRKRQRQLFSRDAHVEKMIQVFEGVMRGGGDRQAPSTTTPPNTKHPQQKRA